MNLVDRELSIKIEIPIGITGTVGVIFPVTHDGLRSDFIGVGGLTRVF